MVDKENEEDTMDALMDANPFDTDDETMDALLKEAITQFKQCRIQSNKITGKQRRSIEVSSSNPALKN